MFRYLKKLAEGIPIQIKATFCYALASVFSQGLTLLTMPIFTRLLSTSEIGIITNYSSWLSISSAIVSLGATTGSYNIAMNTFNISRDQYTSSALSLTFVSSLLCSIAAFFCINGISVITKLPILVLYVIIAGWFVSPALTFWIARSRYENNYIKVVLVSIFLSVTSTIIAIVAVIVSKKYSIPDLASVKIVSMQFMYYIVSCIILVMIFIRGKTFYSRVYWRFTLRTGLPLLIHSLAKQVLDVSDRLMITSLLGTSQAGIYGTLYTLSSISTVFWAAINGSLIPFTFECLQRSEYTKLRKSTNSLLLLYSFICVMLTLLAPEIARVFTTSEYYGAIYLMPPVAAGIFLGSVYNILSNNLLYVEKTVPVMMASIIAAITNVALNYLLIPRYGYIAAAYTTLLSYLLITVILYYFVNKKSKVSEGIDGQYIICLSVVTITSILAINILYQFRYLRYALVLAICGLLFYNRKTITNLLLKRSK